MNDYLIEAPKKIRYISHEMAMIELMERFHRTYQEYLAQPPGLIELIYLKDEIDRK